MRVIDEETLSVAGTSVREYEFDRVFGPMDGQAQVSTGMLCVLVCGAAEMHWWLQGSVPCSLRIQLLYVSHKQQMGLGVFDS